MGRDAPKSEEDLGRLEDLYGELEDKVKDAIVTGQTDDGVLMVLITITARSVTSRRELFEPLDEPTFYIKFKRWVSEGLEEEAKLKKNKVGEV